MAATTAEAIRARLQQWPAAVAGEPRVYVEMVLKAICSMFGAHRAVLAWEDPEEPWVTIAALAEDQMTWRVEAGLLDAVCERLRTPNALDRSIDGQSVHGYLSIEAAEADWSSALADMVAILSARDMDSLITSRSATREAVHEERLRVARDLHDGLLQSFTGVVLQLETLHDMIEKRPADAQQLVTKIQGVIMADQRDLRSYVEQLRPRHRIDVPFDFLSRLTDLRLRFETQWGVNVTIDSDGLDPLVAQSLGHETFRLIQEAVTNAAKHGPASNIRVTMATRESTLWIDVDDDGHGFSFEGTRSLAEIRANNSGPSMLAERIAALNGDLSVESSAGGTHVRISIPLGFSEG